MAKTSKSGLETYTPYSFSSLVYSLLLNDNLLKKILK